MAGRAAAVLLGQLSIRNLGKNRRKVDEKYWDFRCRRVRVRSRDDRCAKGAGFFGYSYARFNLLGKRQREEFANLSLVEL
jgi:hypothetical protein